MRKRSRFLTSDSSVEEPIINLTPLIDVVFVVLITFILIAPVLDIDSVDLAQSGGVVKKEMQPGSLSISVKKDNTIWYQNARVSMDELKVILQREFKKNPHIVPQLIQDKQAQFGTYQELKNTIESIGFEQMDVLLKPG